MKNIDLAFWREYLESEKMQSVTPATFRMN